MAAHAFFRGKIRKLDDDFEKGILYLADYSLTEAERIKRGSVREWLFLLEHKIDEIVRSHKTQQSMEE